MLQKQKKKCLKCKKNIGRMELHKIVIYVIEDEFTEHHYEHIECPERFTVWINLCYVLIDEIWD